MQKTANFLCGFVKECQNQGFYHPDDQAYLCKKALQEFNLTKEAFDINKLLSNQAFQTGVGALAGGGLGYLAGRSPLSALLGAIGGGGLGYFGKDIYNYFKPNNKINKSKTLSTVPKNKNLYNTPEIFDPITNNPISGAPKPPFINFNDRTLYSNPDLMDPTINLPDVSIFSTPSNNYKGRNVHNNPKVY